MRSASYLGLTPFYKLRHGIAGVENDIAIDRPLFPVCSSNSFQDTRLSKQNREKSGACATDVCKVGVACISY